MLTSENARQREQLERSAAVIGLTEWRLTRWPPPDTLADRRPRIAAPLACRASSARALLGDGTSCRRYLIDPT